MHVATNKLIALDYFFFKKQNKFGKNWELTIFQITNNSGNVPNDVRKS